MIWEQNQYVVVEKVKYNENGFDIIGIWMINACYSSRLCIAKSWNSSIFDPKTTQDIKTQNIAEPLILDFVVLLNSSDTFQLLRVRAMNIIALTASRPGSHKTTQMPARHLEGDCWEGHQFFQGFHVFFATLCRYAMPKLSVLWASAPWPRWGSRRIPLLVDPSLATCNSPWPMWAPCFLLKSNLFCWNKSI